jgi:hypothetical protein
MELQLPLQAADLLCWHIQRYFAKTMDSVDHRRFDKLLYETNGYPDFWEREALEGLAKRLRERIANASPDADVS